MAEEFRQFEIHMEDKAGELARIVSSVVQSGVSLQAISFAYEADKPVARFTVRDHTPQHITALERLGGKESNAPQIQVRVKSAKDVLNTLRHITAGGASVCSLSWFQEVVDPPPFQQLTFGVFPKR